MYYVLLYDVVEDFINRRAQYRFAGTDVDKAVVEDEARVVLKDFDSRVTHFAVVLDTRN